jgi:hypothetical protein
MNAQGGESKEKGRDRKKEYCYLPKSNPSKSILMMQ